MPIRNRDDAAEVEDRVERFFVAEADQRPDILRGLFGEVLDFQREVGQFGLDQARDRAGIELPAIAERIASLAGVQVLYVALPRSDTNTDTDRVRKSEVVAVAKRVRDELGEDMLLLFSNGSANQLHWIHPQFGSAATPTLRRIVVERGIKQRTAVQQLSNIYWRHQDLGNILNALNEAFDVEPVTKQFFAKYKELFEQAEQQITGFSDPEDRKQFVQTLFNRLMFVYFLSRKGWLKYDTKTDYLNELWKAYEAHADHDNFYRDRLTFLFFEGLNNPDSRDVRGGVDFLIGEVPFLNGGLFEKSNLDKTVERERIPVPDDAIRPLMTDLFDQFNFTVMESTPFDIEVAVDPEMLGKVFEELVTGRHDSGAYYTPRPVVSFMCREALKGYLESRAPKVPPETIAAFVDERETTDIGINGAQRLAAALAEVTVVDPACGSGAYLLGMMHELVELQQALFNVGVDSKSLYDLKLEIIRRNLHGVDLDPFAVNIAMLRLWLSLAIEFDDDEPEPLPNLDFKIVQGDSLLCPDPSDSGQQGRLGYEGTRIDQLRDLKSTYTTESDGDRKNALRESIAKVEADIRERLSHFANSDNTLDWRIDFAEVIAEGGFDIAVANPPYIQLQKDGGRLGNLYKDCGYETFARTGDIYQLFYERGCQLLRHSGGLMAYITSNSWLRAEYGKRTRNFFTDNHRPQRWLDLGKDVFDSAIVDSGVLMLRTGGTASPFPAVDMDTLPDSDFPPTEEHWEETRPDGDSPWSVLSIIEWRVMDKMLARGTPLKEWDVKINYGIKTGYNKAFIIDTATRNALVEKDPKSAEIIKPVLRGRDIEQYRAKWAGQWLIATAPSLRIDIESFPAVMQHLLSFGKVRLEQTGRTLLDGRRARKRTNNEWFELQDSIGYIEDFSKEKLLWIELASRGRFAYDACGLFPDVSTFFMTGKPLKFLCASLNSHVAHWFLTQVAPTSGMGTLRWKKVYVETIPIPTPERDTRLAAVSIVDRIIEAKSTDVSADTTHWEQEIDRLVYDLYGLTEEEIAAVEARVSL